MKSILKELSLGNDVQVIGKGNSMNPIIKEGEMRKITPYDGRILKVNDIVLVSQIIDIDDNNKKLDGWVTKDVIIGNDETFTGLTITE